MNPWTNSQAGRHAYSTYSQLTSITVGHVLYPKPEDMPCCGDGDPHNTARPPLWPRGNVDTSHVVGSGSIPGGGFFQRFSSTVWQMSGNLGHIRPRVSYGHHISSTPYSSVYGRRWSLTLPVVHHHHHHHHEYSAQRQVLHCKRRNLGCSSAEGRSSTANSGTKAAVLLGV